MPVATLDGFLKIAEDLEEVRRLEAERNDAVNFELQFAEWNRQYREVIEYPASQIFVALRKGELSAEGRLLPTLDLQEAKKLDRDIWDIPRTKIPPEFWSLNGIDFESSAARNSNTHYCHISVVTEEMLSLFPGDRQFVGNVERVGDTLILANTAKAFAAPERIRRGRPPYPWEAFHLEVAGLIRDNRMPTKKEAAIQYFQAWFSEKLKLQPSRAAIGEKLTPYYEKFVRAGRQKS